MMTIEQCRGARALLNWSAQALADEAQVGVATVRRWESGAAVAATSLLAMERALITAGIIFVGSGEASTDGGAGVRLAF